MTSFHSKRHEIGLPCRPLSEPSSKHEIETTHLVARKHAVCPLILPDLEMLEADPALVDQSARVVPADAHAQHWRLRPVRLLHDRLLRGLPLHAELRQCFLDKRQQEWWHEARVEPREVRLVPPPALRLRLERIYECDGAW